MDDSNCDAEILSLLLNAKLVVKCISTAFYPRLIDHLLANQAEGGWDVEEIAKQLKEAGFNAEAGSLLLLPSRLFSIGFNNVGFIDLSGFTLEAFYKREKLLF